MERENASFIIQIRVLKKSLDNKFFISRNKSREHINNPGDCCEYFCKARPKTVTFWRLCFKTQTVRFIKKFFWEFDKTLLKGSNKKNQSNNKYASTFWNAFKFPSSNCRLKNIRPMITYMLY